MTLNMMGGRFVLTAAACTVIVLMICQVDANENNRSCECSTEPKELEYKFSYSVKRGWHPKRYQMKYKKYVKGKLVERKKQVVYDLENNNEKSVFRNFKNKILNNTNRPRIIDVITGGDGYHVNFCNATSWTNSTKKATKKLIVSYHVCKNGHLVWRKVKKVTLKTEKRKEMQTILNRYKSKIKKLYKVDKNVERFTVTLAPMRITVVYKMYKNGKLIDTERMIFMTSRKSKATIKRKINRFKRIIHNRKKKAKKPVEQSTEPKFQHSFNYSTNHGTINFYNIKHKEHFKFRLSLTEVSATFKLINGNNKVIDEKAQLFHMERTDQSDMDGIIRQFTDSIHGVEEFYAKEENDKRINSNVKYQEKITYTLLDETQTTIINYQLYNHGKLVFNESKSVKTKPRELQKQYDARLFDYIDSICRKREIEGNLWNNSLDDFSMEENGNETSDEDEPKTTFSPIPYLGKFNYTTDVIQISGKSIKYNETFSYIVSKGEMNINYTLHNSNGKLFMVKKKRFSLPDNNQAEINRIMRSYIESVHDNATQESQSGDQVTDRSGISENIVYVLSPSFPLLSYQINRDGYLDWGSFTPYTLKKWTQYEFDDTLYRYLEIVHRRRKN